MPTMICPFCKTAWPEEFKWCMEDGAELEQNLGQYDKEEDDGVPGMECPECGARIDPRDEFCAGCGVRLLSREEAEAAAAQFSCPGCGGPINPAEPFCGKCGARTDGSAEPVAAEATAPAASTGILCPNCGMQNVPGDTFCGTCGQQLAASPAQPPAPSQPPAAAQMNIICPQCSLELPQGTDYCHSCGYQFVKDKDDMDAGRPHSGMGACPNCGMEIQPGDAFCGTCGYSMSGQEPAQPAAQAPEAIVPAASSCPNCGMETASGDAICGTCGYELSPAAAAPESAPAAPQAGAPASSCPNCGMGVDPGDDICGTCGYALRETPEAEDQDAGSYDSGSDPSGAEPVSEGSCPNCGMAVDPGDDICGTCGYTLRAAAPAAPETVPQEPAAAAPASSCPNCGMEVEPGEAFCGTCGTALEDAMQDIAEPQSGQDADSRFDYDSPELAVSEARLALRCPECGSVQTTPGGAFCDSCGAFVSAVEHDDAPGGGAPAEDMDPGVRPGDLADPFAQPPAAAPEPEPAGSVADVTGQDLVCPECGVDGIPGETTCIRCGVPLITQSELVKATAATLHTPGPGDAPPMDAPPAAGQIFVCSECGMEAPEGANAYDGCMACGGALTASGATAPSAPEPAYAPPPPPEPEPVNLPPMPAPPPMPEPAAPAGDEKICSCCGTPNPQEADFCAVCGVDLN